MRGPSGELMDNVARERLVRWDVVQLTKLSRGRVLGHDFCLHAYGCTCTTLTRCLLTGDRFEGLNEARQCRVTGSKDRQVHAPRAVGGEGRKENVRRRKGC